MRKALTLAAILVASTANIALAQGKLIAVSWKTFQEERWKHDEAAIKAVVEAAGDKYISTDAQNSAQKQAADIESLIAQKPDVILVVPFDSDAILPSIKAIQNAGIKSIAYDVQFEDPNSLYITYDNVGVGKLMAQTMLAKGKKSGNFAYVKGDKGDPNSQFLAMGFESVLKPEIAAGKIKVVCDNNVDGWKPDNAQKVMEQCLTANNNKIDAVISENDGMASGVVAALAAQGLAGQVAVTGQDGDTAALNRVALGTQLVSVWKDSAVLGKRAGEAAVAMANGTPAAKVKGATMFADGKHHVSMPAILLTPDAITKANLEDPIKAGHVTKAEVCAGVPKGKVAACN
jgi:D-xylose transport system substrate-binding protein